MPSSFLFDEDHLALSTNSTRRYYPRSANDRLPPLRVARRPYVVTWWSAFSPLSSRGSHSEAPHACRTCARKPTNYFRVYKINERETRRVERGCLSSLSFFLPFSLAGLFLRAREHSGYATRKRKTETPQRISKCFPLGRCRLCFPQQWPGPAQVLLTEPPRSTEGCSGTCVIIVNWAVLRDTVITEETNSRKCPSLSLSLRFPSIDEIHCGDEK